MFYFLPFHPFFPFTPFLSFILLSFTHSPPHFFSVPLQQYNGQQLFCTDDSANITINYHHEAET